MTKRWLNLAAAASFIFVTTPLRAAVLITPREAKLPSDETATRGVFSGPKIVVIAPVKGTNAVKSPLDLVIEFQPRGGVLVDANSLSVTYKKNPPVDLTERVKEFLTPSGITMPAAEIPPGHHTIEIEVKDADGRVGGREFSLDIAP
ncbi:MAG: hypothetical protein P4L76_01095 [Beijerinckiaceae bacterium]|nr:hypothetical protein [Beijerinckiaceae bacterium]